MKAPVEIYQTEANPVEAYEMSFTGKSGEYFKIWLSNLALSIITLGLYSPWAKVRRERYFLGNTWLNGSAFDYTADPKKILKGRLIVVGLFLFYTLVVGYIPGMEWPMLFLFLLFVPWAIVQALKFRCKNTRYRGLKFHFTGRYGGSAFANVIVRVLAYVSLFLLYPFAKHREKRYLVDNFSYGQSSFKMFSTVGSYYSTCCKFVVCIIPVIMVIAGAAIVLTTAGIIISGIDLEYAETGEDISYAIGSIVGMVLAVFLFWILSGCCKMLMNRLTWDGATIEGFKVKYDIRIIEYLVIVVTNLALIVVTLGLATPVARLRLYNYKVSRLSVHGQASPDTFIQNQQKKVSALGDQLLADYDLGMDIGF